MYIFPDMINMGLKDGQEFPSEDHKAVAQKLALCNSNVTSRDQLTTIVQEVIAVPIDRIRLVTLDDLPVAKKYII